MGRSEGGGLQGLALSWQELHCPSADRLSGLALRAHVSHSWRPGASRRDWVTVHPQACGRQDSGAFHQPMVSAWLGAGPWQHGGF